MSNPRTRERAAILCSAAASYGKAIGVSKIAGLLLDCPFEVAEKLRFVKLAVRAWEEANHRLNAQSDERRYYTDASMRDDYTLAEALLRTGWSP